MNIPEEIARRFGWPENLPFMGWDALNEEMASGCCGCTWEKNKKCPCRILTWLDMTKGFALVGGGSHYPLFPETVAKIIALVEGKRITRETGKSLLRRMIDETIKGELTDAQWVVKTVEEEKLFVSSEDFGQVVDSVLTANDAIVKQFLGGKEAALNSLVGRCMAVLKSKGDPVAIRKMILDKVNQNKG